MSARRAGRERVCRHLQESTIPLPGWLRRRTASPVGVLMVMLVAFALLLGFAILCGQVLGLSERPDGSTSFDSSITSWVVAHRTHGLTTLARVLSTIGSQTVLVPAMAIVAVILVAGRRLAAAAFLLAAWGGAIGLYSLTKHFVERMRPPTDIWLTGAGRSSSFPSGHATQSLATLLALVLIGAAWMPKSRRPWLVVALALAFGVGWSRVYLGVHWTTDVGAGWLIAVTWMAIVFWLARAAQSIERPPGQVPSDLPRQPPGKPAEEATTEIEPV